MNLLLERIKQLEAENARLKHKRFSKCAGEPRKFPKDLMRRPKSNSLGVEFRLMQDAGRKKSVWPKKEKLESK
jgi:hypothetical protein